MTRTTRLFAILALLLPLPLSADMLYLRQGDEFKGDLVGIGPDGVTFRVAATGEEKTWPKSEVQRVEVEGVKQTEKKLADLDDTLKNDIWPRRVDQQAGSARASRFPESDSVILYEAVSIILSDDGKVVEQRRLVREILTEAGQDQANVYLHYRAKDEKLTVEHARTISPKEAVTELSGSATRDSSVNSKEPAYDDQHELKFALKGGVPGALVDYQTRRESRWNDLDHPWGLEESFQDSEPVLHKEVRVFACAKAGGIAMEALQAEGRLATAVSDAQGNLTITAIANNLPAILSEPQAAENEEISPRLVLAPARVDDDRSTWARVGEGFQGRLEDALATSEACSAKAKALAKEAGGPDTAAKAIYRFVAQDVRTVNVAPYENTYAPRSADDVLKDGFGNVLDKTTLFLALLSKAGVQANLVWVRSQENGRLATTVPTLSQMTTPIVRMTLGGKTVWAYVGSNSLRLGQLTTSHQGVPGLLVDGEKSALVDVPLLGADEASNHNEVRARLLADGTLEVERRAVVVGPDESGWRDMRQMAAEDLKIAFQKSITNLNPAAELVDFEIRGMNDLDQAVTVVLKYRVPEYALKGGDDLFILHVPEINYSASEVGRANRAYPLAWEALETTVNDVLIEIPEGFEVKSIPATVASDSPGIHYAASSGELPGSVKFHDEMTRTTRELAADRYDDWKGLVETRARVAREWIVLIRK